MEHSQGQLRVRVSCRAGRSSKAEGVRGSTLATVRVLAGTCILQLQAPVTEPAWCIHLPCSYVSQDQPAVGAVVPLAAVMLPASGHGTPGMWGDELTASMAQYRANPLLLQGWDVVALSDKFPGFYGSWWAHSLLLEDCAWPRACGLAGIRGGQSVVRIWQQCPRLSRHPFLPCMGSACSGRCYEVKCNPAVVHDG